MPPTLSEHDRLVTLAAGRMQAQGMTNIKAAHIVAFVQPDQIGGYIPDVTAFARGRLCIAECESGDGLAQAHTAAQWRAFYNQAIWADGYFIAVVAKADEAKAHDLLQSITGAVQNTFVWTF